MLRKHHSFPGRLGHWLACLAVIATLVGCAPKLPTGMSDEDLQTCDDTAAKMELGLSDDGSPSLEPQPWQVIPADVVLNSPLSGAILPYGEAVLVQFTQPPPDEGILYRNYLVLVTSLTGVILERVGYSFAVTTQPPNDFQVTWTPPGSGKYIVMVLIRNIETIEALGGNTVEMGKQLELKLSMMEDFDIHTSAFSLAYACVQVDVPKAGGIIPVGTVKPLEDASNLLPTITKPLTATPFTPTFTATAPSTATPLTPTLTSTFTPKPFKPTFTSTSTVTPIPPPPVVNCSSYTDERSCVANDACRWEIPPTGGPGSCKNK